MQDLMKLEPARAYAILLAVWAVATAITDAAGYPMPQPVETAIEALIAALIGVDLRSRVTPVARPKNVDGIPLVPQHVRKRG